MHIDTNATSGRLEQQIATAVRQERRGIVDRAAVLTTAVRQIVETAPERKQWQAVENYLRDELADLKLNSSDGRLENA